MSNKFAHGSSDFITKREAPLFAVQTEMKPETALPVAQVAE